jgi:hypothetical protein
MWPAICDCWSWPLLLSACAVHVQGDLGRVLCGPVQIRYLLGTVSIDLLLLLLLMLMPRVGAPDSQLTRWQPNPCADGRRGAGSVEGRRSWSRL